MTDIWPVELSGYELDALIQFRSCNREEIADDHYLHAAFEKLMAAWTTQAVARRVVGAGWHLAVGDHVRAIIDIEQTPIYDNSGGEAITTDGTVPRGTKGQVIEIIGTDPEDDDSEVVVSFAWREGRKSRLAIANLNHEKWVEKLK